MVDAKSAMQSPASKRGPRPVNLRLRRLLVMLPWLMERGSVSTQEMADHFGLSVKELVAELTLASLCGVSQDPLDLIDLWVDEDEVHVGIPKYFERPLRLTMPEAFTLVASATLALQIPGSDRNGALARAIEKVVAATGLEVEATVAVEIDAPALLENLTQAAVKSEVVTFAYWSVSAGDLQTRRAVPVETFREQDHWYLRAYDIEASSERTFRVDRMESLALTGLVQKVTLGQRGQWFATSEDTRLVTLQIESNWLWMLERYPHISLEPDVDSDVAFQTVRILVSNELWLQRLLLRLGSHAKVIEPMQWRDLGPSAALAVVARYRSSQLA
jgi:proteasome accessory factor C